MELVIKYKQLRKKLSCCRSVDDRDREEVRVCISVKSIEESGDDFDGFQRLGVCGD